MTNLDNGWEVLIEACKIFSKYDHSRGVLDCSHEELAVCINPQIVSMEDRMRLEELGFHSDDEEDHFYSFRFGSC